MAEKQALAPDGLDRPDAAARAGQGASAQGFRMPNEEEVQRFFKSELSDDQRTYLRLYRRIRCSASSRTCGARNTPSRAMACATRGTLVRSDKDADPAPAPSLTSNSCDSRNLPARSTSSLPTSTSAASTTPASGACRQRQLPIAEEVRTRRGQVDKRGHIPARACLGIERHREQAGRLLVPDGAHLVFPQTSQ